MSSWNLFALIAKLRSFFSSGGKCGSPKTPIANAKQQKTTPKQQKQNSPKNNRNLPEIEDEFMAWPPRSDLCSNTKPEDHEKSRYLLQLSVWLLKSVRNVAEIEAKFMTWPPDRILTKTADPENYLKHYNLYYTHPQSLWYTIATTNIWWES